MKYYVKKFRILIFQRHTKILIDEMIWWLRFISKLYGMGSNGWGKRWNKTNQEVTAVKAADKVGGRVHYTTQTLLCMLESFHHTHMNFNGGRGIYSQMKQTCGYQELWCTYKCSYFYWIKWLHFQKQDPKEWL